MIHWWGVNRTGYQPLRIATMCPPKDAQPNHRLCDLEDFVIMDRQLSTTTDATDANLDNFLRELTDLSRKYGLALTGKPTLFVMEADDHAHSYYADDESRLLLV